MSPIAIPPTGGRMKIERRCSCVVTTVARASLTSTITARLATFRRRRRHRPPPLQMRPTTGRAPRFRLSSTRVPHSRRSATQRASARNWKRRQLSQPLPVTFLNPSAHLLRQAHWQMWQGRRHCVSFSLSAASTARVPGKRRCTGRPHVDSGQPRPIMHTGLRERRQRVRRHRVAVRHQQLGLLQRVER